MVRKLAAVDAYIDKAAPFAQPILRHFRALVHAQCPDAGEAIKWGMPHFVGNGILCYMAAFKQHCAFGFRFAGKIVGDSAAAQDAMGQFGRITALKDLPGDAQLRRFLKQALELDRNGTPTPNPARKARRLVVPADLRKALAANKAAQKHFDAFSASARNEYISWITEAKQAATRARRLATTLEWVAEGRHRNWQYMQSRKVAKR